MRSIAFVPALLALALTLAPVAELPIAAPRAARAAEVEADVPERVDDLEALKVTAVRINPFVYKIEGQGAIFLVNTSEGVGARRRRLRLAPGR